jgi:hypothetical protein
MTNIKVLVGLILGLLLPSISYGQQWQYQLQLTPNVSVAPNIGDRVTMSVSAVPTGNGPGTPSLYLWSLYFDVGTPFGAFWVDFDSIIVDPLWPGVNLDGVLEGWSPGGAVAGFQPVHLFDFTTERYALGDYHGSFSLGRYWQGNQSGTFTGGDYYINDVPTPSAILPLASIGIWGMRRRR